MVRSMMSQTTLAKSFYDNALESAAHILNMVPTKKVEKTSYEVWHGQALKMSYLKVLGSEALVKHNTLTKPDKLEPKSIKCIFVGYPRETMGYSFYYPPENKVLVARNAEFFENSLINTHPSKNTSLHHDEDDQEIDERQSDIVPVYRSIRTRHAPDGMCLYVDAEEHELGDLNEPTNYKDALLDPKYDKWFDATFRAIRILIAITAFYDYEIWQMDVKTAFLNGYLNKEVYIEQPEGKLHWTTIKNILKYLRNTKDMFLVYGDVDDTKSQTEYLFILNGGVVDWKSTKQSILATSSAEGEYIAALDASKEAVWIRKYIYGLGVVPINEEHMKMYCDNTEAITIANEPGITIGARHYRTKVHYLREVIKMGDMVLEKVHTDENVADPFTKALPFNKNFEHTKSIRLLLAN
ncbi:retrotransposon protein, putative, ty1-copia subclass [Tanacetum coccineum]